MYYNNYTRVTQTLLYQSPYNKLRNYLLISVTIIVEASETREEPICRNYDHQYSEIHWHSINRPHGLKIVFTDSAGVFENNDLSVFRVTSWPGKFGRSLHLKLRNNLLL